MCRKFSILSVIIAFLSIHAFAQQSAWFELDKHYKSGLELLENGKYAAASNQFNSVIIFKSPILIIIFFYSLKTMQQVQMCCVLEKLSERDKMYTYILKTHNKPYLFYSKNILNYKMPLLFSYILY